MNDKMIYKQHSSWSTTAAGFFLIILFVSKYSETGSLLYRLKGGVAYPALFILMGYHMPFSKNLKEYARRAGKELISLIVPAFVSCFLLRFYTYAVNNWGNVGYLYQYLKYYGLSIFYSAPRDLGDINSVGPVWILICFYIVRRILDAINLLVKNRSKISKAQFTNTALMLFLTLIVGIIGLVLSKRYIVLPVSIDIALIGTLLSYIGKIWKQYEEQITNKILLISFTICLIVGAIGWTQNKLMDIVGLSYPGIFGGVIYTLSFVYVLFIMFRAISKISPVSDIFTMIAQHFTLITVIFELDAVYSILWHTDIEIVSNVIRVLIYFSICEMITQTWGKAYENSHIGKIDSIIAIKYHRAIDVTFYISFITLYVFSIMGVANLFKFISAEDQAAINKLAAVLLLGVYALKIACAKNKYLSIFLTAAICITACGSIVRQGELANYQLIVLIAASINVEIHVIGRIVYTVGLIFMLIVYYLSMNGYIPYDVVSTSANLSTTGHAFGFLEKNTLAAFILGNAIAYCVARKSQKRAWIILDVLVIGFGVFINNRYIGGRSDMVLMILLLIGTVVYRLIGSEPLKNKSLGRIVKLGHYIIGVPIYVLVMLLYIIASLTYDGVEAPFQNIIEKFTDPSTYNYRLWLSKTALLVYKQTPWGQYIFERGVNSTEGTGYFYIDCSYIRILMMSGIIFTAMFLTIVTIMQYRNAKNGHYYLVFLGIISALSGIMGHRMTMYTFNIIPVLAFTRYSIDKANRIKKLGQS